MNNHEKRDERREKYYPKDRVKLLLIGEAPPCNDAEFFYKGGRLRGRTLEAFVQARELSGNLCEDSDFNDFLFQKGCYLDDILHAPIRRGLSQEEKHRMLADAFPGFTKRLATHNPQNVVLFVKGLDLYVRSAMAQSGANLLTYDALPFPGYSQKNIENYITGLADVVRHIYQ